MTVPVYRQRYRVLQALIQEMDVRLDGAIPRHVLGLSEAFEDDVALVGALQMRWYTRLGGHIDIEQERLHDLDQAVVAAWRLTRAELPGVRLALDRVLEDPTSPQMRLVLEKARRNEHIMLALKAGLTWFHDDRAAALGADLERIARQEQGLLPRDPEASRRSLMARLRSGSLPRNGCRTDSKLEAGQVPAQVRRVVAGPGKAARL